MKRLRWMFGGGYARRADGVTLKAAGRRWTRLATGKTYRTIEDFEKGIEINNEDEVKT